MVTFAMSPEITIAQAGQLDPAFNSIDNGFGAPEGTNGQVRSIAQQPDGKIIIGGAFSTFNGTITNNIGRLNLNGSLDLSFNAGGTGADNSIFKILLQPDGKIIVAGKFSTYNGISANKIIRLNTDGSRDAGFNMGTGFNDSINTLTLQADGKILAGGNFTTYNGTASYYIIRINTNGSKDASFTGAGITSNVNDIALQSNEKILVGMTASSFFKRLNANGTADATFNIGGTGTNGPVKAIRVQADGKILFGGDFSLYNTLNTNLTRINANGTLDASFDNTSGGLPGGINAITIQADGKILVAWGTYIYAYYSGEIQGRKLTRLNANGTADLTFQSDFYSELNENVYTVIVQADGKILAGENLVSTWIGSSSRYESHAAHVVVPGAKDFGINRYNSNGSRDQNFCINALVKGANRTITAVASQTDGKILIGGFFFSFNGAVANYCTRLNADGTRDAGFNAGGKGFDKKVSAIAVQADGKIIVGGSFTSYNNAAVNNLTRLNADGSTDVSFIYPEPVSSGSEITSLAVQPDGKIVVGGSGKIFRLNTNGSVDGTYSTVVYAVYGVFFPYVYTIALQPDGKILAGGYFTGFGQGDHSANFGRLNTDGSKDNSFEGGANAPVNALVIQPNGRIVMGGNFTEYNGISQSFITRVSPNGIYDASFNPGGTGANGYITSIALAPDGKFIIAGNFTSYNGIAASRLARLNSDGTLDAGFNTGGSGANDLISSVVFDAGGRNLLIGGNFTSYNGAGKNRITRISNCSGSTASTTDLAVCAGQLPYTWNGNSFNAEGTYTVILTNAGGCDSTAILNLSVAASAISGPARACAYIQPSGGTANYNVTAAAGSTLTWSVSKPATMLILSGQGTNHITMQYTNDFISGTVYVRIVNSACSIDIKKSLVVSRTSPSTPSSIIAGSSNICPFITTGDGISYIIPKTAFATSYNWNAQSGSTIIYHPNGAGVNDTTVYVRFAANFTTSSITVQAVNDCGTSNVRSLTVKLIIPSIPGAINGPANVCEFMFPNAAGGNAVYTVPAITDVLYNWSMSFATPAPPYTITFPDRTNSISTTFRDDFTTGSVSVSGTNGCGTSAVRTLKLKRLVASTPGAIAVTNTGFCPNRVYTYTIPSTPANSTSVVWSVPAGATLQSGQGTNAISVSYPSAAITGNVSVQAMNNCSVSSERKVTVNLPACPSTPFARNGNGSAAAKNNIPELHFNLMEVMVFPNPGVSDFKLQVNTSAKEVVYVKIFEIQGRLIKEMIINPFETFSFGSGLEAGTYIIEVKQGNNIKTTRWIKF